MWDLPGPGIEPVSPAFEVRSLNHWTTREVRALSLSFMSTVLLLTSLATGLAFSHTYLLNPFSTWCSSSGPGLSTPGYSGRGVTDSHHGMWCEWCLGGSPGPVVEDAWQCGKTRGGKSPLV